MAEKFEEKDGACSQKDATSTTSRPAMKSEKKYKLYHGTHTGPNDLWLESFIITGAVSTHEPLHNGQGGFYMTSDRRYALNHTKENPYRSGGENGRGILLEIDLQINGEDWRIGHFSDYRSPFDDVSLPHAQKVEKNLKLMELLLSMTSINAIVRYIGVAPLAVDRIWLKPVCPAGTLPYKWNPPLEQWELVYDRHAKKTESVVKKMPRAQQRGPQ